MKTTTTSPQPHTPKSSNLERQLESTRARPRHAVDRIRAAFGVPSPAVPAADKLGKTEADLLKVAYAKQVQRHCGEGEDRFFVRNNGGWCNRYGELAAELGIVARSAGSKIALYDGEVFLAHIDLPELREQTGEPVFRFDHEAYRAIQSRLQRMQHLASRDPMDLAILRGAAAKIRKRSP